MSKERLVALLKNAEFEYCEECAEATENGYKSYPQMSEYFADYLISNGVIVSLCKVGDTVYQTDGVRIYELEILDVLLHKNKPYYETESIDFDNDAIGKSIFLTREEAEAKLEENKRL